MDNQAIRDLKPGIYVICREGNRVKAIQNVTNWTPEKVGDLADIQTEMGRDPKIKRIS